MKKLLFVLAFATMANSFWIGTSEPTYQDFVNQYGEVIQWQRTYRPYPNSDNWCKFGLQGFQMNYKDYSEPFAGPYDIYYIIENWKPYLY